MLFFLLFIELFCTTLCFNIDTNNAIKFTRGSSDSLFGYKVVLNDSNIYIGAPYEDTFGVVYKCSFNGNTPRRDEVQNCIKLNHVGTCFRHQSASQFRLDYYFQHALPPQNQMNGWETISIMNNVVLANDEGEIIYGLPLARAEGFSWNEERIAGSIAKYVPDRNHIVLPKASESIWIQQSKVATSRDPHSHDMAGTAIVRGNFFKMKGDHYAIGAPKADSLKGRVYVCYSCFQSIAGRFQFHPSDIMLTGEQMGERFGQTLAAVDLDGDAIDDLVVGAPLNAYREGVYDTGMVYVYQSISGSSGETRMELRKRITTSSKTDMQSGARFGAALTRIGDMDQDGLEDFAVGAPYEGPGAVYIYRGHKDFVFNGKTLT